MNKHYVITRTMARCLAVLALVLISVSTVFAAPSTKKKPKPVTCPTIVDIETREYSNAKTKYLCYSKAKDAMAWGYVTLSKPSLSAKLNACLTKSASLTQDLSATKSSLDSCNQQLSSHSNCPLPTNPPNGLYSLNEMGSFIGGVIVASDGTFLGVFSHDKYSPDSIANEFGNYGSRFSATSIFNEFGNYGSQFSSSSAFSTTTLTPPILVVNSTPVGYITMNHTLSPRINAHILKGWLASGEY